MRWFHVINKGCEGTVKGSSDILNDSNHVTKKRKITGVNFPMKLKVTHRKLLKFNQDCTGAYVTSFTTLH